MSKDKIIIGIDYGMQGAIAKIDIQAKKCISIIDMPIDEENEINATWLYNYLKDTFEQQDVESVYAEHVVSGGAMASKPSILKQGKTIGHAEGFVKKFCEENGIEYHRISPQRWKSKLGLSTKQKKASVILMEKVYNTKAMRGAQGGAKDGRGDALCMAHYGYLERDK